MTKLATIDAKTIEGFASRLADHPIYSALLTVQDLRCFMQQHIYSVWDFMSLIKYLQAEVAPTTIPWLVTGDASVRRFINELVLEEESDQLANGAFVSHLELYIQAMREIGADPEPFLEFLRVVRSQGIQAGLELPSVPTASRHFTQQTFKFLASHQAHQVAAALALGREHIIPTMFRSFLARMQITEDDAPMFHFYLKRHVHLDEDFHAPLSLRLLNGLCAGDTEKIQQAVQAAHEAVTARLQFWDDVLLAIQQRA